MIPKILHYCWFGKKELPKVSKRCIKSWQRFFPDYQWICWNEDSFDIECNAYVLEAYRAGKYAYVSDYARLFALYRQGGVYLDVDCLVKKSFDSLLAQEAFTGFGGDNSEIAACTMAFASGNPFIKKCLDSYKNQHFVNKDGSFNLKSVNIRMTEILMTMGFALNGIEQVINGIHIYPMTYFCPLSMLPDTVPDCKSKKTFSMTIWTDPGLLRERSLWVRFFHKTGLNKMLRSLIRK